MVNNADSNQLRKKENMEPDMEPSASNIKQ